MNSDLFEGADRIARMILVASSEAVMGGEVVAGTLPDASASLKLFLKGGFVQREFNIFGDFTLIEETDIRFELTEHTDFYEVLLEITVENLEIQAHDFQYIKAFLSLSLFLSARLMVLGFSTWHFCFFKLF